jgi:hypothetical protein
MFRTLIVLAALALSGCASYGTSYGDARAPVYRDGSYYSPSAQGYGDYYYAPEYRYDGYYDDFYGYGYPYGYGGYGYGYGSPYGLGSSRYCSFRYRPCGYGSYWGSGFGLSLFFGRGWDRWNGWNSWDPWWPYYYGGRDRDRDWDRNHGTPRPRQPNPPYTGGDRNRAHPPGESTGWPNNPGSAQPPRNDRPIQTRDPYPIRPRDRNRTPVYGDERREATLPMPRDRNFAPAPRDRNDRGFVPTPRERNDRGFVPTPRERNVVVMPRGPGPAVPAPVDRNRGGGQFEAPRAPAPRDRNDDDGNARSAPPPASRERSDERRDSARRPRPQ